MDWNPNINPSKGAQQNPYEVVLDISRTSTIYLIVTICHTLNELLKYIDICRMRIKWNQRNNAARFPHSGASTAVPRNSGVELSAPALSFKFGITHYLCRLTVVLTNIVFIQVASVYCVPCVQFRVSLVLFLLFYYFIC